MKCSVISLSTQHFNHLSCKELLSSRWKDMDNFCHNISQQKMSIGLAAALRGGVFCIHNDHHYSFHEPRCGKSCLISSLTNLPRKVQVRNTLKTDWEVLSRKSWPPMFNKALVTILVLNPSSKAGQFSLLQFQAVSSLHFIGISNPRERPLFGTVLNHQKCSILLLGNKVLHLNGTESIQLL